jgi:hypothetical protein
MDEARRRKQAGTYPRFGTPTALVEKFLAQTVLRNSPDTPMVALGPVVWGREPGARALLFARLGRQQSWQQHLTVIFVKECGLGSRQSWFCAPP